MISPSLPPFSPSLFPSFLPSLSPSHPLCPSLCTCAFSWPRPATAGDKWGFPVRPPNPSFSPVVKHPKLIIPPAREEGTITQGSWS